MKLTKSQLKQIIKEEVSKVLGETPSNVPNDDAFRAWLTRAAETQNTEITEEKIDEGLENVNLENLKVVYDAAEHFIKQPEMLSATIGVAGGAFLNQLADIFKEKKPKTKERQ